MTKEQFDRPELLETKLEAARLMVEHGGCMKCSKVLCAEAVQEDDEALPCPLSFMDDNPYACRDDIINCQQYIEENTK